MSTESPVVVLFDMLGNEMPVQNGAAIPASTPALMVAGSDGTDSRYLTVDTSGRTVIAGAGTAGTPAAGVVSIQGVSGGTVIPISITGTNIVTANQGTANTLANAWPFEITDRTNGPAAVKAASTAAVAADPALVVAISPNNAVYTTPSPFADRIVIGNIVALNGAVTVSCQGIGTIGVAVTGTWVATLIAEYSIDGTNWFTATGTVLPANAGTTDSSGGTTNNQWVFTNFGYNQFRFRASAYTSGTIVVTLEANAATTVIGGVITIHQTTATNCKVQSAQGPGSTLANAWTMQITDTTNGPAAVKAASTAAVATNPALVVAVSPNNSVTVVQPTAANLKATTASESTTAAAVPALATFVGGQVQALQVGLTAGDLYPLSLTTAALLRVDGSNVTQPVSGTVTANAGTGNFNVIGTGTAGTAATGVVTIQGIAGGVAVPISGTVTATNPSVSTVAAAPPTSATYVGASVTTAAPTYTTGQMDPLSLTTGGLLRIDGVYPVNATTPTTDITFIGGAVTTAAPAYTTGQLSALSLTTTGNLRVDGSSVTQPVSGTVTANAGTGNFTVVQATAANLNATVTGTVTANAGTGNFNNSSVSATGAAGPASATYVAGAVTTAAPTYTTGQMDPLSITTGGLLRIDGVYPINAATPTSDATFVAGAVTTAAPTYTTGQMDPLSLTTAGQLRIDGVSATGATAGADAMYVAGAVTTAAPTYTTGQMDPLSLDTSGNLRVTGTTSDVTATGALGALNANVQLTLAGHTSAGFQLAAGTLIGTIVAEVSFDGGTTWVATYFDEAGGNKVSSVTYGTANTALGSSIVGVGGSGAARIRVSAYTSGTANITLRASTIEDPSVNYGGQVNATFQPPTAAQIAGWDGTTFRVPVVKAGSTAAVAGDQALVVAISPNNTITTSASISYGTSNQTITITLASLANAAQRQSTAITNTTFTDALVQIKLETGAAGVSATGIVNIYAYASSDGGTTYGDTATGTNGAVTLTSPPNLKLIGTINTVANATSYDSNPMSVAAIFAGNLPQHWGIVVENKSGAAFNATAGNFAAFYQGIN